MTFIILLGVVLLWAFFIWGFLRVPPRSSWVAGLIVGVSVPFLTQYYPPLVMLTSAGHYFLFGFFESLFRLDIKNMSDDGRMQLSLLVELLVSIPFYGLIVGTIGTKLQGKKIKNIQLIGIITLIFLLSIYGYNLSALSVS